MLQRGRTAGQREAARPQGRSAARPAARARRRAPHHAGAAQSGRQCDQVHGSGRSRVKAAAADGSFRSRADTGPGIPKSDQAKIFEEFQQADSSSTRKKGGTGLGLRSAKRIVEMHGGRIWVESSARARRRPSPSPCRCASSKQARQMRKRILVIEDHEDNRQIMRDSDGAQATKWSKRDWRGGDRRGCERAARSDPHGHPASRHGRLRGDTPDQGEPNIRSFRSSPSPPTR